MFYSKFLAVIAFVFCALMANAQWELNPTNPPAVCDEVGVQNALRTVVDGEGGVYIFWIDGRNSNTSRDVYGQHYNAQGEKLWEPQGREILNLEKNIEFMHLYGYANGELLLAYYANVDAVNETDGIYTRALDTEGSAVWAQDLFLAQETAVGALSAGYFYGVQIIRNDNTYMAMMTLLTYGYNRMRVTTFDNEGTLTGVFGGTEIGPLSFGSAAMIRDHANGAYVYYSNANGMGGSLMVNRLSPTGLPMWSNWANITAGSPGLGYQFGGVAVGDGFMGAWVVNEVNIIAQKLDTLGNIAWGQYLPICEAAGTQNSFIMRSRGDAATILWRDTRPGVVGGYAVYGQRFLSDGTILWPQDGLEIVGEGSSDPLVSFNYADNESIVIFHRTSATGFKEWAQKIMLDGSKAYGDQGILIAEGSQFVTTDMQKAIVYTGTNILAVWRSLHSSATMDNIYISRIQNLMTYTEQVVAACNSYTYTWEEETEDGIVLNEEVYTESGDYTFELPDNTILTLHLTIDNLSPSITQQGNTLNYEPANATLLQWLNCDTEQPISSSSALQLSASGTYACVLSLGACVATSECVFATYTGVDEYVQSMLSVYPNPGNDELQIAGCADGTLVIYNSDGREVHRQLTQRGEIQRIHTEKMPTGFYIIRLLDATQHQWVSWMKQ